MEGRPDSEQTFSPEEQETPELMGGELSVNEITMMINLNSALTTEDYESVASILTSVEYDDLVSKVEEGTISIFPVDDTNGAIYPGGDVYFGDMQDGIREGDGLWLYGDSDEQYGEYYDGEWENDLPNGAGKVVTFHTNVDSMESEEGTSYARLTEATGVFNNGYYEGEFTYFWEMTDGAEILWNMSFVDGVAVRLESDDDEYYIAVSDTHGYLTGDDSTYCVFGFGESESDDSVNEEPEQAEEPEQEEEQVSQPSGLEQAIAILSQGSLVWDKRGEEWFSFFDKYDGMGDFPSGIFLREDGNAAMMLDSTDSPDGFNYHIYTLEVGGKPRFDGYQNLFADYYWAFAGADGPYASDGGALIGLTALDDKTVSVEMDVRAAEANGFVDPTGIYKLVY